MTDKVPIACELGVFSCEEREEHQQRIERIVLGKALAITEEEQGFLLRYSSSEETLIELSRWIAKESRCCHFLRFRLDVSAPTNEIELRLIGNEEAKNFIRTNFGQSIQMPLVFF